MGKHVVRQTPRAMPTAAMVDQCTANLPKPFLVAGCRGTNNAGNKEPDFAVHGDFRFATGSLADLVGKHVIVFVHGYNLTAQECLTGAKDFFTKLHKAVLHDGMDAQKLQFLLFTWPGDTGTLYFNDAQQYAHLSGAALCELLRQAGARQLSIVTHSLGAHVALRAAAGLGERLFHGREVPRIDQLLLLAASVEDDVFERPERPEEYHFAEAAFGVRKLHITASRADEVLGGPFRINESDEALGYCGPESMHPLVSLSRRVREVLGGNEEFSFELHDLSPSSPTILNPQLHVRSHGGYWKHDAQLNYYVNLIR